MRIEFDCISGAISEGDSGDNALKDTEDEEEELNGNYTQSLKHWMSLCHLNVRHLLRGKNDAKKYTSKND